MIRLKTSWFRPEELEPIQSKLEALGYVVEWIIE